MFAILKFRIRIRVTYLVINTNVSSVDLVGLMRQMFVDTHMYVQILGKFEGPVDRTRDTRESPTPRSEPTMLICSLVFLQPLKAQMVHPHVSMT